MTDTLLSKPGSLNLLTLPGELRNLIYGYVLEEDIHFCVHHMLHECFVRNQLKLPPLLQVCRQIRIEATSIWFSEAIFQYHSLPQLERWLKSLLPAHRNLIRAIRRWIPHLTLAELERDMLNSREMLARLGMLNASQVMNIGCLADHNGVVTSTQSVRWFRGPGEVVSDGPVQCVVSGL